MRRRWVSFFFVLLIFALSAIAARINLADSDSLIESGRIQSLHYWVARIFSSAPLILLLLNVLLFFAAIFILIRTARSSLFLPLLANPFAIFNVLDPFNKFSLTLFASAFAASCLFGERRAKPKGVGGLGVLIGLHPINILVFAFLSPIIAGVVILFLPHFVQTLSGPIFDAIAGDKAGLLLQYGAELGLLYGGNYTLSPLPADAYFWTPAIYLLLFPAYLLKGGSALDWALAIFLMVGYVGMVFDAAPKERLRMTFLLFSFLCVFPIFIGNIAVIYRQFIPILPFFIIFFRQRKGRWAVGFYSGSRKKIDANVEKLMT